jgi:hypothetical protein
MNNDIQTTTQGSLAFIPTYSEKMAAELLAQNAVLKMPYLGMVNIGTFLHSFTVRGQLTF